MAAKCRYNGLKMLTAASVIADFFESDKEIFIEEYSSCEDPFLENFRNGINMALSKYYGINTKEALHDASLSLGVINEEVLYDLSVVRAEIEYSFREQRQLKNNILSQLGFAYYWRRANSQISMHSLLLNFRSNMNLELKTLLVTEGVDEQRLGNVMNMAERLHLANVFQELLKDNSQFGTESIVNEPKRIYDTAMEICLKGQQLFRKNKKKQELYVFSKVLARYGTGVVPEKENMAENNTTLSKIDVQYREDRTFSAASVFADLIFSNTSPIEAVTIQTGLLGQYNSGEVYKSSPFTFTRTALITVNYSISVTGILKAVKDTGVLTDGKLKIIQSWLYIGDGTTANIGSRYAQSGQSFTNNPDSSFDATNYLNNTGSYMAVLPAGTYSFHIWAAVYSRDGSISTAADAFKAIFGGGTDQLQIAAVYISQ